MRSNQGTLIHQKPIVASAQRSSRATCSPTVRPPTRARWRSARTCWSPSCPGRATTSRTRSSSPSGSCQDDELTSIHIEEYEIDARTTKLGDEEITRDIPNRSEESLRNLDDRGIVRIGAEVQLRRPAGRQGHAEGRDRAHRRGEADPRDLQGEGARGPRHLAKGAPRRGRRRDRRHDLQPRRGRRSAARGQRAGAGVRREEAQDRRGRQARRAPRQQGRDLEDRRRRGHAVHGGRHAGRRDPQPAGRPEPNESRADSRDPSRVGGRQRLV